MHLFQGRPASAFSPLRLNYEQALEAKGKKNMVMQIPP